MLFKVTTVVFMTLSVVFASLYLVERSAVINQNPLDAQTKAQAATIEEVNKEELKKSNQTKEKKAVSESLKTVVLTKEVSSHPELTKEEIDLMLEIKNSMSRDYSRRLEREHPLLFERLQLDEAQKEELKLLIGERRLGLNLKPAEGASEEEKAAYQLKKDEILGSIDNKIAEVLSEQTETYLNYREKSQQYQVVFDINKKLSTSGEPLDIEQQDQLADIMHVSRRQAEEQNGKIDWRAMRESPEKAEQALNSYKERHEIMKAEINFLTDNQREAFVKHLDSRYKRYEDWVKRVKRDRR
ncbi:MAG: hypothetical protein NE328_18775 [Lentisphaeraceae bacterium]|nr:hypothetical protein [Lentisphaeraceae bacterium]